MRVLLTGGSGDLGTLLTQSLLARGDEVVNIDLADPKIPGAVHVRASILDRAAVRQSISGVDCVVHIAAWHGVHETTKTPDDFHDLNVTGTYNMLQAAAEAGVKKFVFISSTSVDDANGMYGHTKILGEKMVEAYAARHVMQTVTLRPRAFIPSWNREVYARFMEWAAWFIKGAVHVEDVTRATLIAIDLPPTGKNETYVIDGAYEYAADDLNNWDSKGTGSTFAAHYPQFVGIAAQFGLDTARRPKVLDIPAAQRLPGYQPAYSLKNLLQELELFGDAGPPAPYKNPPSRKSAGKSFQS